MVVLFKTIVNKDFAETPVVPWSSIFRKRPWGGGDRGTGFVGRFEVIRLRKVTRGAVGGVANVVTEWLLKAFVEWLRSGYGATLGIARP